jgi:hypothetical protein
MQQQQQWQWQQTLTFFVAAAAAVLLDIGTAYAVQCSAVTHDLMILACLDRSRTEQRRQHVGTSGHPEPHCAAVPGQLRAQQVQHIPCGVQAAVRGNLAVLDAVASGGLRGLLRPAMHTCSTHRVTWQLQMALNRWHQVAALQQMTCGIYAD